MRCTGHCCDGFTLNQSPGKLAALAAGGDADAAKIIGLIRVKSYGEGNRFLLRYRCKALLANGDCGVYEERPEMCRRYPDGGECRVAGCTLGVEGRCV